MPPFHPLFSCPFCKSRLSWPLPWRGEYELAELWKLYPFCWLFAFPQRCFPSGCWLRWSSQKLNMMQIGRFNESENLGVDRGRILWACWALNASLQPAQLFPTPHLPTTSPYRRWIYPVTGVSSTGFYLVNLHKPAVSEEADSELLLSAALTLIIQLIAVLGLCGWQISSWCAVITFTQVSYLKTHTSWIITASCLAVGLVTHPEGPCWPEMF